ncbi:MAG: DNA mismatch repair protein MutS [Candidatus Eisenbacteria bacterium]
MKTQTPLMRQYGRIKEKHRDSILLFRMGDFYEMFYDDAVVASGVLGLALTSRDRDKDGKVPLAGIPWHSAERYISKLIQNGYSVAICEQTGEVDKRKKLVTREVVEVITPGTVLSESLLEAGENNYVVAVVAGTPCGLAVADVSTGEFAAGEMEKEDLWEELSRISPAEIVVPADSEFVETLRQRIAQGRRVKISQREAWRFSTHAAVSELLSHFKISSLECFGVNGDEAGVAAAGALLAYLKELKGTSPRQIFKLSRYRQADFLFMDESTIKNLELVRSSHGCGEEGSLLGTVKRTETPMGARFLRASLLRPLVGSDAISARHDAVAELTRSSRMREKLVAACKGLPDVERLLTRVANRKGGPRDVVALGKCLAQLPQVRETLSGAESSLLRQLAGGIGDTGELDSLIQRAFVEEAPVLARSPGFVRPGFSEELDSVRECSLDAKKWIRSLQERERNATGIASLRVGFNKVFGYYIEVSKTNLARVPADYVRKQTLVNAERYITADLKEKEVLVLGAEESELMLELKLLRDVQERISESSGLLLEASRAVAEADFLLSSARVAMERGYVRPQIREDSRIVLRDCRHPVVEAALEAESFVPNDVEMNCEESQIVIITGPNMAGKSTYIRQVALAVILAQAGCFVPASDAEIGIADRVFCRMGASDDIARGRSTFLTEMSETASILHNCSRRSLVVFDEMGRGTSTFDGMSIAWSVIEYLHSLGPRTLFATHYHELTALASRLERAKNLNVLVKEWGDRIVFVRKVVEGASDRSYGIQVARLAGLPEPVIERAKEILLSLENGRLRSAAQPAPEAKPCQLDLFSERARQMVEELRSIDVEQMRPVDAIRTLDHLKQKYAVDRKPGRDPSDRDSEGNVVG